MRTFTYSHYVGDDVAIIGDAEGFGAVTHIDNTELISPIYHEILPIDLNVKTLLVFERRMENLVIGIYSVALREWLHLPQFTHATIKNFHTLWVWIGKHRGECDIITGKITWKR